MAKIKLSIEEFKSDGEKYYKITEAIRPISELDIAYAAGIIDGEGSIVISKAKQKVGNGYSYEILVAVHMMDGYIPKWMSECFGGRFSKTKVNHANKKGDFAYYYHANGSRAKIFLELIIPHLKIKRKQAEAALYLQNKLTQNPNGKRVTAEMYKERDALKMLIEELKTIPVNERERDEL